MESIEFNCRKCESLLRVRGEDQDKLIRCPKCQELQRYLDQESMRPIRVDSSPSPGPLQTESWSLRAEDGREWHDLDRQQFELLLRQGHLDTAAYFLGGEFRQWTPVQKLFYPDAKGADPRFASSRPQSSGHGGTGPDPLGQASTTSSSAGYPGPSRQLPFTRAGHHGSPPPNRHSNLPDGNGTVVLVLGVLGIVTFCVPVLGLIGFLIGLIDLIRMGNGDLSGRYNTRLLIGFLLCTFSLLLGMCQCQIRLG